MSIPPDSPPTSHDFGSTSPLDRVEANSIAASPLASHTNSTADDTISQIAFPSSVEHKLRSPPPIQSNERVRTLSTRSTGSSPGSGGAVLAELARALGDQTAISQAEGPALDLEWIKTQERGELEALLAAADQVIRDSKRDLHVVATVGKALLDENAQLKSRHDSLLARTSPTKTRSSLGPSARHQTHSSIASVSELRERHHPSPALHKPWQQQQSHQQYGSGSSGANSASGAPRGRNNSDATTVGSAPTSPTTSNSKYAHLGVGGSPTTRSRLTSTSSVASLFAPAPRTHASAPGGDVQELTQANYALTLQLTELEADTERAEQEGKRKSRRLEKELQGLRAELSRVEERNGSLEDRVHESAYHQRHRDTEQTPRFAERTQPKSSALAAMGIINDFAPRAAAIPEEAPSSPDTPTAPSTGSKHSVRRQASLISAPDELVTQLMEKINELQRENEAIEEGRIEMEDRLDRAQDEVEQFKRKCEELEDELESNQLSGGHHSGWGMRQPSITWRGEEDYSPPSRPKGNRRDIDRRNHQRKVSSVSQRSTGEMSFSYSDKSLAESARTDSPTPGPRFGGQLREVNGISQGRTLESELGDGSTWGDERSVVEHDYYDDEEDYAQQEEEEQQSCVDSLDYDEEHSTIGTDSTSTPVKSTQRVAHSPAGTTLHPLLAPGSLRRTGPPDSDLYENISKAASNLKPVWADESDFPMPAKKPVKRGLQQVLLKSLDWAREGGPVEDDEETEDLWEESKYPEKDEHNFDREDTEEETRERIARLGHGSLRSRLPQSKLKRIASGVPGWQEGDSPSGPRGMGFTRSMSKRDMALRRLGLETDEGHSEQGEDREEDEDEEEWSEEELGVGVTRRQKADYYPVSLRARYAPKMVATRAVAKAVEHLQTILIWVHFFISITAALAFAFYQGPEKMLGTKKQKKIRSR